MNGCLTQPSRLPLIGPAMAGAAAIGSLVAIQPRLAVGLVVGGALVALPFVAPVTHLVLLVVITATVPFEVQARFAFGAGPGSTGLIVSDVLLLGGLLRALAVMLDLRLTRRAGVAVAIVLALLAVAIMQFLRGLSVGQELAGPELRPLLGFGVLLVALPIVVQRPARDRLFRGLVVVGLVLALWGIVQWSLNIPFSTIGDAGVRRSVPFATTARGALQGGLYGYPIAATLALAALVATDGRSPMRRVLLVAVLALNCIDLLLTYERVLWISTLAAFGFVVLKSRGSQRVKGLLMAPAAVMVLIACFAIVAPTDLAGARERLVSVGQYGADRSLRFRTLEADHVIEQIRAEPILGSGLGATILWGRPYEHVRPAYQSFSHNSYLWLVWKLGFPGAALLAMLFVYALVGRRRPGDTATAAAVQIGAQAALFACALQAFVYPNFVASITVSIGLLLALCVSGRRA